MHIPIYFYFLKKKLNISTVKVRNATMYFNLIWWKNLTNGKEGNILLLMPGRLEVLNMLIHHWIQIPPHHRVTAAIPPVQLSKDNESLVWDHVLLPSNLTWNLIHLEWDQNTCCNCPEVTDFGILHSIIIAYFVVQAPARPQPNSCSYEGLNACLQ